MVSIENLDRLKRSVPRYPVRENWLHWYIKANAYTPQSVAGMRVAVTAAVLEDFPQNCEEFGKSRFTVSQKRLVGEVMSRAHKSHGIPLATKQFATEAMRITDDRDIQSIWKVQTIPTVIGALYSLVRGKNIWFLGYGSSDYCLKALPQIQEYFNDPDHLDGSLAIASAAREMFTHDSSVRKILHRRNSLLVENAKAGNRLYQVYGELGEMDGQLLNYIRDVLSRQFDESRIAWIAWED